ncbi:Death-associated inhibitor of apoptosis 2 [Blattella germanica]|nr:Death-associated inhibitor of apoptosis 2 [Blattella germanica]
MNIEKNRLRTFETWPANVEVEPQRIAKAGFFSTGLGLEVQCFCCGGKISEWNYGDQVMARHRALDPQCPFVRNPTQSGNVPFIPGATPTPASPPPPPSARPSISTAEEEEEEEEEPQQEQQQQEEEPQQQEAQQNRQSSTVRDLGVWDQGSAYRSEEARLQSFRTWPISYIVAPERLAKAGFYYLQEGDKVQCAFCSGIVGHWEACDDPAVEHRRHFPSCPLNYGLPVGNVPLTSRDSVPAEPQDMSELGIHTHRGPCRPRYSTVESRIRTYSDWPHAVPTPQLLAQAGFYHVGTADQVRCFHCDGGLKDWDTDDDPWIEHARWFSRCGYVRLVKGDEFVQQARVQRPPVLPTEDAARMSEVSQPPHKVRDVTDEELQGLMETSPAVAALEVGLDVSRIKMALRHKVEQTGATDRPVSQPILNPSRSMPTLSNKSEPPTVQMKSSSVGETSRANAQSMPHLPSLEEEVRRLKEARLCKICMDEEVGVVFLPCGHLVTCVNCAPSLHDCPVCRQLIKATVRTFLS